MVPLCSVKGSDNWFYNFFESATRSPALNQEHSVEYIRVLSAGNVITLEATRQDLNKVFLCIDPKDVVNSEDVCSMQLVSSRTVCTKDN